MRNTANQWTVDATHLLGVSRLSFRNVCQALDVAGVIRAVPGDGTYIAESTSNVHSVALTFMMLMKKVSKNDAS